MEKIERSSFDGLIRRCGAHGASWLSQRSDIPLQSRMLVSIFDSTTSAVENWPHVESVKQAEDAAAPQLVFAMSHRSSVEVEISIVGKANGAKLEFMDDDTEKFTPEFSMFGSTRYLRTAASSEEVFGIVYTRSQVASKPAEREKISATVSYVPLREDVRAREISCAFLL